MFVEKDDLSFWHASAVPGSRLVGVMNNMISDEGVLLCYILYMFFDSVVPGFLYF